MEIKEGVNNILQYMWSQPPSELGSLENVRGFLTAILDQVYKEGLKDGSDAVLEEQCNPNRGVKKT